jgi:hypothetical protein
MPNAQIPVTEYIRNVPADLRPTLQAARKTIKQIAPKATETAWRTWPIRYRQDDLYVVAVGNYPRWISVFFFRGGELDDPDAVLEGTGKLMRHIKLREPKDASRPALKRMLGRAFRAGGITMRSSGPRAASR